MSNEVILGNPIPRPTISANPPKDNKCLLLQVPRPLFLHTMDFFLSNDIESFKNFRICSKRTYDLCNEGLHRHLRRLDVLTYDYLTFIRFLPTNSDNNLNPIYRFVPNLTHLRFCKFTNSTVILNPSKPLLGLKNCDNVRTVTLNNNHILKSQLGNVFENIPSEITRLELNETIIEDEGDKLIAEIGTRFPDLVYLNLNANIDPDNPVSNLGLKSLLTKCTKLQTLHIKYFNGINDEVAEYFSHCKDLTDLNLYGTSIGPRGVKKIVESCPKISILDVRRIAIDNGAMFAICRNCKNLTEISMDECSNLQFAMLAQCSELRVINIYRCHVTDSEFEYVLTKCQKLQKVFSAKIDISDDFDLGRFRHIEFFL